LENSQKVNMKVSDNMHINKLCWSVVGIARNGGNYPTVGKLWSANCTKDFSIISWWIWIILNILYSNIQYAFKLIVWIQLNLNLSQDGSDHICENRHQIIFNSEFQFTSLNASCPSPQRCPAPVASSSVHNGTDSHTWTFIFYGYSAISTWWIPLPGMLHFCLFRLHRAAEY
jgi:hypothetical protein